MTYRRETPLTRRRVVVVGGLAAVVLSAGIAGQAIAGPEPVKAISASTQTERPPVVDTVSKFYDGYITALGEGETQRAQKLRKKALTAGYLRELKKWEAQTQADGVLRSQNVPTGSAVRADGAGAGHVWTVVTLKWDRGGTTKLGVQVDNESRKISDIKPLD